MNHRVVTYILSGTVSKLWLIIGQIFACESRRPHFNSLAAIFTSPETRMTVLPDSENRMIVASFVSTKHRNVTEGRTDGQIDTAMANTAVSIASCADAL